MRTHNYVGKKTPRLYSQGLLTEGKSFTECMDVKTLKPTAEWLEIYGRVKKELRNMGILSE
jgi:hypothetical protein